MADQRLNQVIAVEAGLKSRVESAITALYHTAQKAELFFGLARTYRPVKEDGERLPPERKMVQKRSYDIVADMAGLLTGWFNLAAAREYGNSQARADVAVAGETVLRDVPVTALLFLEKQLVHVHTIVSKLCVLDEADVWKLDTNDMLHKTDKVETARSAKVPKALVLYPATEQHPAQVQAFTEDVIIGYYEAVRMSGAMPGREQRALLGRVEDLQRAVKVAREQANMTVAPPQEVGTVLFRWLLNSGA